jgi:hypothetical protein
MGRTITAITPAKGALALYVKECGRGFFTKDVPVQCWALTHDTHGDAVFTEVWGMVDELIFSGYKFNGYINEGMELP